MRHAPLFFCGGGCSLLALFSIAFMLHDVLVPLAASAPAAAALCPRTGARLCAAVLKAHWGSTLDTSVLSSIYCVVVDPKGRR